MSTDAQSRMSQAWAELGDAIDHAEATGASAESFLTRLSLLLVWELDDGEAFTRAVATAHRAAEAAAVEPDVMRL